MARGAGGEASRLGSRPKTESRSPVQVTPPGRQVSDSHRIKVWGRRKPSGIGEVIASWTELLRRFVVICGDCLKYRLHEMKLVYRQCNARWRRTNKKPRPLTGALSDASHVS
jgi:hypothetical protein